MRKLLIVEDDTAILGQLTHALSKTYEVKGATDRVAALEVLGGCGYKPDAVVLDLGLPPFEDTTAEGIELMNWIHSNTRAKVIVLTGQKSREAALESVKTGTFDYLMKPVDPARLLFSIERAILFKDAEEEMEEGGHNKLSLTVKVGEGLQTIRDEAEKNLIIQVLRDNSFNVYKSAKVLGVKRESLYYFMKKFGLERERD